METDDTVKAEEKRAAPRRRTKTSTQKQNDVAVVPAQADWEPVQHESMEPADAIMEVQARNLAEMPAAPKKRTKAAAGKSARKRDETAASDTDATTGRKQTRRTVRQTEVRVSRQTAEQTTIQWREQEMLGPAEIRIVRQAIEQAAMQWREQETRGPVALAATNGTPGQLAIAWPDQEMTLQPPGKGLPLDAQPLYVERAPAEQQEARADLPTEIRVSVVISVPPGSQSAHVR